MAKRQKMISTGLQILGLMAGLQLSSTLQAELPVAEPETVGISSQRLALLTTMLNQHIEDGRVPGLVAAVARHGKLVYLESMGWQQIEPAIAMQDNSLFQIRSMSKPVTSLAVMQLAEQGLIALEDPVSRYIPSFGDMQVFVNPDDPDNSPLREPAREITIADLLLNMGGLSHRLGNLYSSRQVRSRADTLEQLVEKVAAVPLLDDPGSQWVYSISATVLGRVVEIVSGQRFDKYLQQAILEPLGMTDTGFHVPADKVDRLVQPYQLRNNGQPATAIPEMDVPITREPPLLEGAAGLVSTVPDYLLFLQTFLDGGELAGKRVLSEEGIASMITNHVPVAALPIALSGRPLPALGWGYGFSVVVDSGNSPYGVNAGEFGWNGSLGTFSWADPQTDTIAILMMQIAPSGAWDLSAKFKALVYQSLID